MTLLIPSSRTMTKRELNMLKQREFMGEEFYLWMLEKYEQMRAYRNAASRHKPSEEEMLIMKLNKPFEDSYRRMLFGGES